MDAGVDWPSIASLGEDYYSTGLAECGVWRYSFLPSILIKDSIHCSVQTYRTLNRFLMQDLTFASPCGSWNGYF